MVRVVTAAQAAARDAAAIRAGTPSRHLMQRAGTAAADLILQRVGDAAPRGVTIVTGPGNNGGDGWVVAGVLARRGVSVRVHEVAVSRTGDARAERDGVSSQVSFGPPAAGDGIVVDALLGTGARAGLDAAMTAAVDAINAVRDAGASVVALDLPTGVHADDGQQGPAVLADLTVSFGTVKRGHLLARGNCGEIVVVDIGLGVWADLEDGAPALVDASFVAGHVPPIAADSHKGTRRRVAIVGGARGMAGAVVLAGRAAVRSGAGMVRLVVETESLPVVQASLTEATAATWPSPETDHAIQAWAHALLVGPGLGLTDGARRIRASLFEDWSGPAVLDADALNHFEDDVEGLATMLAGRPSLITPHVNELARLIGVGPDEVSRSRFDVGADLARTLGATVLLKGVPTVIFSPGGERVVSASGTPALAAAGSGDLLGGIAVTLLAQTGDPFASAACAAWIHGRAAEIANAGRPVRGVSLDDVLDGLGRAWDLRGESPVAPVLASLPRAGDRPSTERRHA